MQRYSSFERSVQRPACLAYRRLCPGCRVPGARLASLLLPPLGGGKAHVDSRGSVSLPPGIERHRSSVGPLRQTGLGPVRCDRTELQ
jgi:hypothetical protein